MQPHFHNVELLCWKTTPNLLNLQRTFKNAVLTFLGKDIFKVKPSCELCFRLPLFSLFYAVEKEKALFGQNQNGS